MDGGSSQTGQGSRFPAPATLLLIAAALIALASAAAAMLRPGERAASPQASPPVAAQSDAPVRTVQETIAAIEAKLRERPNDPVGWRMLGWSHFEAGNLPRSADAYRRAAELEPGNGENWSSLGEALQTASTTVSPEAEAAFRRAVKLDPADPRARYFLAVQTDLKGDHEKAVTDWIALLKETPPGAPWQADLRRTIEQVAGKHRIDLAGRMPAPPGGGASAAAAAPGPTGEQMAAAAAMPQGQQSEMVRGMVERLATRLKEKPRDADGWVRLMRARMVLGDKSAAADALRSGLAAFQGDAATQARLNQAADELGIARGG